MGIFRQFPYSNFHEMNMDWLLKNWNELAEEWATYKANIDTDISELDAFKDFFEAWIGDNIDESVYEWLESHPEAVTMNWFVTPQMYGAKADGVTDDLTAFNAAIASGKQVIIPAGSYFLSETIFSDESIIYQDNGTYTDKTVFTSRTLSNNAPVVGALPDVNLTSLGMKGIQSAAFNTRRRKLVLGTHLSVANDLPIIVEIEPWSSTPLRQIESASLGHVNDMTYNPRTDRVLVVTGNINEIIPVNAAEFTLTNAVYTNIGEALTEISYDEVNDLYIVRSQSGCYMLDNEFNMVRKVFENDQDLNDYPYKDIQGAYFQGSTFFKSQFLTVYWLWGTAGSTSFARIAQYNYATGYVKKMYDVAETFSDCEPETVVVIDNDLYILSYINESLAIRQIVIPKATLSPVNNSIGYNVRVTSPAAGVTVSLLSLLCNENMAHIEFNIKFDETWTVGTSKGFRINIAGLNGFIYGWSGETLIIGYVNNNEVTMRAFCADGVATWSATMRGNLIRM